MFEFKGAVSPIFCVTSINYLLLRMARMEMDCNLKKLASFFKFVLCIAEKSSKTAYSLFFPG